MTLHLHPTSGLFACALGALLASGSAGAATEQRSFVQNATGACQAALPVYDGLIRKRPLALQNEGSAAAFVSCSFVGTDRGAGDRESVEDLYLYVVNNTATAVSVSCTMIDGTVSESIALPKTMTVAANAQAEFLWSASESGSVNFNRIANVSCNLPVGTGLTTSYVYFDEEVGS